jgi:glycosyltransferase involved in cell wall biosynthesis
MTRLLYVVNSASFFLSHRLSVATAALQQGFEVHLAATLARASERHEVERHGISLHSVHFDRSGYSPLTEWRTRRSVARLYRSVHPDLVHLVTAKPVLHGGLLAQRCHVPAVVSAIPGLGHLSSKPGVIATAQRALLMGAYRLALRHPNSRVIFQNRENMDAFLEAGATSSERSVLIRGSGVDPDKFDFSPEPTGTAVVVLASRMLREKGIHEFVEAARILRSKGVPGRFVLVGGCDKGNPSSLDERALGDWSASGPAWWSGSGIARTCPPCCRAQTLFACRHTMARACRKCFSRPRRVDAQS